MKIHKTLVAKEETRLDKFLQVLFPQFSRAELQNIIAAGDVLVDDVVVRDKSKTVKKNQRISLNYNSPKLALRPDIILPRIYDDNDVLVVDKPPGIVVHPNPRAQKPSVAAAVLAQQTFTETVGENKFRPGIVHRLDVDTSGVLIMAKTQRAYEHLKNAFQSRKIYKEYLVLVHGKFKEKHGKIESAIGRITGQGKLSAGIGRPAATEYWVQDEFGDRVDLHTKHSGHNKISNRVSSVRSGVGVDTYSLLRVQLHTGRTHQIRVHFSSLNHPVCGDKLYGGAWKQKDVAKFPRQFLHAHKLRLILPSGKEKEFVSPVPKDLQNILDKF